MESNKIYLCGDVNYTNIAKELYTNDRLEMNDFLLSLQELMSDYGVVKIDISIDPYLFK